LSKGFILSLSKGFILSLPKDPAPAKRDYTAIFKNISVCHGRTTKIEKPGESINPWLSLFLQHRQDLNQVGRLSVSEIPLPYKRGSNLF
jgi:hypothetical protein